jgi:hypothetical protein
LKKSIFAKKKFEKNDSSSDSSSNNDSDIPIPVVTAYNLNKIGSRLRDFSE